MISKIVTKYLTVTNFVTIMYINEFFIQRRIKMTEEVKKINELIELKEKALSETKEKYKKDKEAIFSPDEFNKQKKFVKQSSGFWLGILIVIVGIAFFAFPELENGDSGKGILFIAGSLIVGIIVQKIKNSIFKKMVNKDKYERYIEIEKEEKESISTILKSIEDSKLDILEIKAREKRANTLFVGTGLDIKDNLHLNAPAKFEFTIDGVSYGNIRGVSSFPMAPGRHVVTAKYTLKVSKDDNHYDIEDSVPSVVVEVDENGAFVFFELGLYMKGFQVFTDEYFKKVNSKDFNRMATEYGSKVYY